MAGPIVERFEPPVVEDQQQHFAERPEQPSVAAVAAHQHQIGEQLRYPLVQDRAIVAAGPVPERAGDSALAHAGRPGDLQVVVGVDPRAADQRLNQCPVEAARGGRCPVPQSGDCR